MTDYVADLTAPQAFRREDAQRLAAKVRTDATYADGVMRWTSNNSVPPADVVALAAHLGLPVSIEACDRARSTDLSAFAAEYRRRAAERTPEQVAEQRLAARAAHGPGVRLVNVISGERFTT